MTELHEFFQALAEPNRIRIVNLLFDTKELCVCDIERILDIPQTRVSRHLGYLKRAGLVSSRREGQWMHYMLVYNPSFSKRFYSELKASFAAAPRLIADIEKLHSMAKHACNNEPKNSKEKTQ